MAKFTDSRDYGEIIRNSDTELAIIAFRNRVAEMWKAEVTTDDAVKGDNESNGLIENPVSPEPSNVTLKAAHKNHSATTDLFCRGWWNMQDASCPDVKKVVTGGATQKTAWQETNTRICPILVKRC